MDHRPRSDTDETFETSRTALVSVDAGGSITCNAAARSLVGGDIDPIVLPSPLTAGNHIVGISADGAHLVSIDLVPHPTGWVGTLSALSVHDGTAVRPDPSPSTDTAANATVSMAMLREMVHGGADVVDVAAVAVALAGHTVDARRAALVRAHPDGRRALITRWGDWPLGDAAEHPITSPAWIAVNIGRVGDLALFVATDETDAFDADATAFLHRIGELLDLVFAEHLNDPVPSWRSGSLPDRHGWARQVDALVVRGDDTTTRIAVAVVGVDLIDGISSADGADHADAHLLDAAGVIEQGLGGDTAPLIGKVSSNELVVAFIGTSAAEMLDRLDSALAALEAHGRVGAGVAIPVTGVRARPHDLLRDATAARMAATQNGRRLEVFHRAIGDRARFSLDVRRRLGEESIGNQIVVHYQPVIDLRQERVSGAEALARWQHPELGLLGPEAFIPAAEATGRIRQVGASVLSQALGALATWRRDGVVDLDFTMAVNLAPLQLEYPEIVTAVTTLLEIHRLDPSNLCLEITESSVLSGDPMALDNVGRLRDLGVKIAIDDFGTGYSSLAQLRRLPVTTLKLDRSFVVDVDHDADALRLAAGVLEIAHGLDLDIVAEGAERIAQADLLRDRGCDRGQGFLWSRPIAVDAFTAWLEGNRHHVALES